MNIKQLTCLIGLLISANTMAPVRNNELTPVYT